MSDKNYGVITEQGYPTGQFGFQPITEAEKKSVEESEKAKKKKEEKEY